MGKAPAFQFYAAEYLADEGVQLLTLEQEGIYNRLQAYCWREGSIPADTGKLSRLCKNAPLDALDEVLKLFTPDESQQRFIHKALEAQRQKQASFKASCAERGAQGAKKRWQSHSSAIDQLIANDDFAFASSSSSSTATKTKKKKTPQAAAAQFSLPSYIDPEAWSGYEQMRVKARKPLTDRARQLAVAELQKLEAQGYKAADVLNQSTMNSWMGLFAIRQAGGNGGTNQTKPQQNAAVERQRITHDAIAAAGRRRYGIGTAGDDGSDTSVHR